MMNCCEATPKTDENVPQQETIGKILNTSIDCEQLRQQVLAAFEGKELPFKIEISDDPGRLFYGILIHKIFCRYLCAYIYYCSLLLSSGRCLFVHIPPFDEKCTPKKLIAVLKQIVIELHKMKSNDMIANLET